MRSMSRSPSAAAGFLLALVPGAVLAQQSIDDLPPQEARSLRGAIAESLYRVEPASDGRFVALNPTQAMRSAFGPSGVEVRGRSWTVSLALEAWGREGAMLPLEEAELHVDGRRVEYRRGALTEWYVNEARGLEQGFTIAAAPAGEGPLTLVLSAKAGNGELRVDVLQGGRDARFTSLANGAVLHYAGLRAWDATGRELPASLSAKGRQLSIGIEDEGAVYPLVVDPWIATEVAKLTASDAADGDLFGSSVAVSGDTAVVGAPIDTHAGGLYAGSAYVFERNQGGPGVWGEVAKLTASDGAAWDEFGTSVAVSGETAVVGAPWNDHAGASNTGSAYVFERDQGGPDAWGEVAKLTASDAAANDSFGVSVAVCGDTVVVGASFDHNAGGEGAGSAYVFERDQGGPSTWGQVVKLTASDATAGASLGTSVAISSDTALIGADWANVVGAGGAGAAYVFERDQGGPGAWGEVAKLEASLPASAEQFGYSVAVSGDTAVVGSPRDKNTGGNQAGAAFVFERDQGGPGTWGRVVKLKGATTNAHFGWSVAVSGDLTVVGGFTESASVFHRDQGGSDAWGEIASLVASDAAAGDQFGRSVAVAGGTALVGADGDDHAGGVDAGSAYVFGISFESEVYCTAGISASGCQAGLSAVGTASASASSGFVLSAAGVEGSKDGMFFWGTSGKQANSWGNGTSFQCVVPPVTRGGLLVAVGTNGTCDGSFAQDLNATWCHTCLYPQKNPGAGAIMQAQLWYRDPLSTSNQTTSFSDAIEVLVEP